MIAIDFFCGCGGASEGLKQAGFNIILGLDIDPHATATFKENFPDAKFIQEDIRHVKISDIEPHINKLERPLILSACAPCQPFSQQNKNKNIEDSRIDLLDETHRFVIKFKPEYILLENVPGMQKIKNEEDGPFCRFLNLLKTMNYSYTSFIANAEDYGIPQRRKRLVLLASLLGDVTIPETTHGKNKSPYKTVRDFIGDFTSIKAGENCQEDNLHRASELTELNLRRIQHTPEGGDRRDWPEELVNECHKKYHGHTDTYGRMFWDKPAPTLTTKCNSYSNGRFGHPDINQNRAISIREASRLQTFPLDYKFRGTFNSMAKQIGNAVPCELAKIFGLHLVNNCSKMDG